MIIIGIIHLIPLRGIFGSNQLHSLYGVYTIDPNLEVLMQHRAFMLGIFGFLFIYGAIDKRYQRISILVAYMTILSFLILTWSIETNFKVTRVVLVDFTALLLLMFSTIFYFLRRRN